MWSLYCQHLTTVHLYGCFKSCHRGYFRKDLFFSSKTIFFWSFPGDCIHRTDTNFPGSMSVCRNWYHFSIRCIDSLEKDGSVKFHVRNLRTFMLEVFKTLTINHLNPEMGHVCLRKVINLKFWDVEEILFYRRREHHVNLDYTRFVNGDVKHRIEHLLNLRHLSVL